MTNWRRGCLIGCAIMIAGATPMPATAETHFHVKNCSTYSVDYQIFNGNDTMLLIPYKDGRIGHKRTDAVEASTHRMACGSGKSCKALLIPLGFDSHPKKIIRIKKDYYLRIVDVEKEAVAYEYLPGIQRTKTSSILTYKITERSEACTDPAPDAVIVRHD